MGDSGVPFFDKLPQELRDRIYQEAFHIGGKHRKIPIVHLDEWFLKFRHERLIAYDRHSWKPPLPPGSRPVKRVPMPFFGCPFACMAVNKRFYDEATASWAHLTIVEIPYHRLESFHLLSGALIRRIRKLDLGETDMTDQKVMTKRGLEKSYRTDGYDCLRMLANAPCLRELHATLLQKYFAEMNPSKLVCWHNFTKADYENHVPTVCLTRLVQLDRLVLVAADDSLSESFEELAIWRANVEALERYINVEIREAKGITQAAECKESGEPPNEPPNEQLEYENDENKDLEELFGESSADPLMPNTRSEAREEPEAPRAPRAKNLLQNECLIPAIALISGCIVVASLATLWYVVRSKD